MDTFGFNINTLAGELNWEGFNTVYHKGKGIEWFSQLKQDLAAVENLR